MDKNSDILAKLKSDGMLRILRGGDLCGAKIEMGQRQFLNYASNDYLGLSSRLDLQREFLDSAAKESGRFIMSSSSSRLLGGNNSAFAQLEEFFEEIYNAEISDAVKRKSCLVFNCGYHANNGILPALFDSEDFVVCDKLSHASILDSLKLGSFKWQRFPHNDMDALEDILKKNISTSGRVCIVTESVFSMDGDRANLKDLVDLKNKYNAKLYLDEAHSIGVFGNGGLGLAQELGLVSEIDFLIGTLGKAAASCGAFAMCSQVDKDLLVNRCRPFIFTTANAPINQMWSKFIFKKIMKADDLRVKLKNLWNLFRESVGGEVLGDTQIAPLLLGDVKIAAHLSEILEENGVYAPIVRPPTVPKNSSRIRFSLNADISKDDILFTANLLNNFLAKGFVK